MSETQISPSSASIRRHVAVDLGASGGRVALATFRNGIPEIEIVHRFRNGGVDVPPQRLYWNILGLWHEIQTGLKKAAESGPIESVGVNTWGVDYALLDERGDLIDQVHHYRSRRTDGVMDGVLQRLGRDHVYEETGIQMMPINTIYQLVAHLRDMPERFDHAQRLLFVPDLLHFWLSGRMAIERTIASTSQLYSPRTRDWSWPLIDALGLPRRLFGPITDPGTVLGTIQPEIAELTGLHGTKVVLPGSHDTASAVAAVPAEGVNDWAYVSSGTWSLVGIETRHPVLTVPAARENLTNEAGIDGTTRLLKNVMGLWILQECRRAWGDVPYNELYAAAERATGGPTFDPDDEVFLAPGTDMPQRVRALSGVEDDRGAIVRCIFDSLAVKTASVLDAIERVTEHKIKRIHVVGGGSTITLLNRLIAETCGRPVIAGPVEATVMGNLLVQAEACGTIAPDSLRATVAAATQLVTYP